MDVNHIYATDQHRSLKRIRLYHQRPVSRVVLVYFGLLLVPVGFAHCFMTIQPDTEVLYKVSAPYSKEHEGAIRWNDPAIGIDGLDIGVEPTLSDKDEVAPFLADFDSPFTYEG